MSASYAEAAGYTGVVSPAVVRRRPEEREHLELARHRVGLDPVKWTPTESEIRCLTSPPTSVIEPLSLSRPEIAGYQWISPVWKVLGARLSVGLQGGFRLRCIDADQRLHHLDRN